VLAQFEQRLIALFNKLIGFKLLDVHLNRVADIALTEREESLTSPKISRKFTGGIELRGVRFRYAPLEVDVLKGIDVRIEPGQFVALTGPSGHGKSTLLKLLVGVCKPTSGELLYDDVPLRNWGIGNIRQRMGVVMQDDTLLAGSIEENICLFDNEPDRERIKWAAQIANILEDIDAMPMGMNTLVSNLGTTLSGGQQQRIMIARALYRRPKILVLDEGTSQLDIETEERINSALKDLKITRIAAAHRPDTLAKADRIISIVNGLAFEDGEKCQPTYIKVLPIVK